jgi:hypothetical protein
VAGPVTARLDLVISLSALKGKPRMSIRATVPALVFALPAMLAPAGAAWAINPGYAKQLEQSGCTQVTELQGCDIRKSKAENAKAGFGSAAAAASAPSARPAGAAASPYAGRWLAKSAEGRTLSTIRVDEKDRVWVNGKRVTAKRLDGGLLFTAGKVQYMIQGDRRLKDEDVWRDVRAGTQGMIVAE